MARPSPLFTRAVTGPFGGKHVDQSVTAESGLQRVGHGSRRIATRPPSLAWPGGLAGHRVEQLAVEVRQREVPDAVELPQARVRQPPGQLAAHGCRYPGVLGPVEDRDRDLDVGESEPPVEHVAGHALLEEALDTLAERLGGVLRRELAHRGIIQQPAVGLGQA